MGLLSSIAGWFGRGSGGTPPLSDLRLRDRQEPPQADETRLLALYRTSIEFRQVVGTICQRYASVPWTVTTEDGEAVGEDHPLQRLIDRPNDVFAGSTARYLERGWLDVLDETCARIMVDTSGRAYLWPLNPCWVERRMSGQEVTYRVQYPRGESATYSDEEIVWSSQPDLLDPYGRGKGLGIAAADDIEIAEYSSRWVKSFFYNSAQPDAIVGVEDLSQEQGKRLKERWHQRHRGVDNAHGVEFVGGKISYLQLQATLKDLTIPEIRKMSGDLVRQLYGVPPELVGQIESSNRATITEALAIFAQMVLVPRLKFQREEWTAKLLPRLDAMGLDTSGLSLEYDDPTPADQERRDTLMSDRPWAFTVNEHREAAGLSPREDGDVYYRDPRQVLTPALPVTDEARSAPAFELGRHRPEPTIVRLFDDSHQKQAAETASLIVRELDEARMELAVMPVQQQTFEGYARRAMGEVSAEFDPEKVNPRIAEYLQGQGAEHVQGIDDTTREALRAELTEGIQAGEGTRQLTARVSQMAAFGASRAELIAYTETHSAANAGKVAGWQASGVVTASRWVISGVRTRPSHAAMSGQVRPLGQPFVSGRGNQALYPGGFGAAAENARCRCTVVAAELVGEASAGKEAGDGEDIERAASQHVDAIQEALTAQLEQDIIPAIARVIGEEVAA